MGASEQYCLRWNNHLKNFTNELDRLLTNHMLTDVTLGVENGRFLKCHKVVLATCSLYFRSVFNEIPTEHSVILFKDVKYTEMKAIVDFMYRGEVSVADGDIAALFQVAEFLQVKGLVAGNEIPSASEQITSPSPTVCSTSSNRNGENPQSSENFHSNFQRPSSTNLPLNACVNKAPSIHDVGEDKFSKLTWPMSPIFQSDDVKPSLEALASFHPFLPTQSFPIAQHCDNIYESTSGHNLRGSNVSGNSSTRQQDTPILRSVLNPERDDAAMRLPINRQDSRDSHYRSRSNGSANSESIERRSSMDLSQSHRDQSSYESTSHNPMMGKEERRAIPRGTLDDAKCGVGGYSTAQKQEIRRYKKYSSENILDAIRAVKDGLSANKAAEKFNVPSRTLYDKIKKLAVQPKKPRRSEKIDSAASLPYYGAGNSSTVGFQNIIKSTKEEINDPIVENPASIVETTFDDSREKFHVPEDEMDVERKSPCPRVYHDNVKPRSPDESQNKNTENEAEDLSTSRRSSVHVIVSPSSAIQETV